MKRSIDNVDSIMFDMDGTLWDAMNSYAEVWNVAFKEFGIDLTITGEQLVKGIGKTIDEIMVMLLGKYGFSVYDADFLKRVDEIENELLPELGGTPYPGMVEGLKRLSGRYKLFLVSNCGALGLNNFMNYTGIGCYITDYMSYGMNKQPKCDNMKLLKARYGLQNPVYVGDTQSDCNNAHKADIPFVFASYGFGDCEGEDERFDSFQDIVDFFMKGEE